MAEMSAEAVLDVLSQAELLAGLTVPDLRAIVALGSIVHFEPDTVLLSAGHLNGCTLILLNGLVEVCRENRGAVEQIARLGPGACLGEMSSLTGRPATLTVRALGAVRVLVLSREDLLDQLARSPKLGTNLAFVIIKRLQGQREQRRAMMSLLTLGRADECARSALERLLAALAPLSRRTVVVDLHGCLDTCAVRGLPSIAQLTTDPASSVAIDRELCAAAEGFWILSGGVPTTLPALSGVLELLARYCDQLLLVADPAQSRALLARDAEHFRRHLCIVEGATPNETPSSVERRVLLLGLARPAATTKDGVDPVRARLTLRRWPFQSLRR